MTSFQKRFLLSIVLVFVAIIALAIGMNTTTPSAVQSSSIATQPTSVRMTLEPEIIANMTSLPEATPLSGEDAQPFLDFEDLVNTCEDYSEERRLQMTQHIQWLIDPAAIPTEMLVAFGSHPHGTLILGMAGYTSTQWRILERPGDSCLIEIGRIINLMLVDYGREPITIYDESS